MNASILKIIAIIAMVVDHVGYIFFPQHLWLRVIGRLTMPLMAFFAVEGFRHTRNIRKYLFRLLIFAVLSEIPFKLAFGSGSNVIITIFLGVSALYLGDLITKKSGIQAFSFLSYIMFGIIAELIGSDWSYIGIGFICLFYLAGKSKLKMSIYISSWYLFIFITIVLEAYFVNGFYNFYTNYVQLAGLLSIPLIYMYNGKLGPRLKYLFYISYPGHLIVLYLIREFLIKFF